MKVPPTHRSHPIILAVALLLLAGAQAFAYDLPAELRQQVDRLVAEIESEPTTAENMLPRVAVLWRWANAVSLQGGYVHKNLPPVVMTLTNPNPGTRPPGFMVGAVDDYVRQLAWLDDDPDAFGRVSVVQPAQFEAASWATIEVRWRVGSRGVGRGGGVVISTHTSGGYGRLQTSDPSADHYVSLRVEGRPEVRFEEDKASIWGPYGGFRGPADFPLMRIANAELSAGDVVVVTFGDRSGGSRGLQVGPFSNDSLALPLHVDPGDGRIYGLPPATFSVVGGAAARVHGFAPSIVAPGERYQISVRTEDAAYNRATRELPGFEVRRNGAAVEPLPAGQAIHLLTVTAGADGVERYSFRSPDGAVVGEANPVWVRQSPARRIYWGETHGHSGFAEGQGTPDGFFEFARDDARLDFATLSEHDIVLTDGMWKALVDAARRFHREGEIILFPGYEWTSVRQRGGHHNVFLRGPKYERVNVQKAPDLTDLYRGLRELYDPADVLIIPHAHQAGDWRLSDLDMETLVEVMSGHGTFEWFGQRYLDNGFRTGFIAASDDHLGHPGYSPGHPQASTQRRSNIYQFGGLAAAWAPEKTTDAIFDALKARHAYGTTGARRIILDARLNEQPMGTELALTELRQIEGRAIGTAPIRSVQLIRDGEVTASFEPRRETAGVAGRAELAVGFESESWVAIRDNPRGQRAWTGTLTVDGARVVSARLLGTPHYQSDQVAAAGNEVRFTLSTRGSRRAFALVLDDVTPATSLRFAIEASDEFGVAPLQVRTPQHFPAADFVLGVPMRDVVSAAAATEKIFAAGEYRDSVRVDRMEGLTDDLSFRFADRQDVASWYYIRVEQIDGHLAWSSPWWVGGERPR